MTEQEKQKLIKIADYIENQWDEYRHKAKIETEEKKRAAYLKMAAEFFRAKECIWSAILNRPERQL